jgi:hypothetical protein
MNYDHLICADRGCLVLVENVARMLDSYKWLKKRPKLNDELIRKIKAFGILSRGLATRMFGGTHP